MSKDLSIIDKIDCETINFNLLIEDQNKEENLFILKNSSYNTEFKVKNRSSEFLLVRIKTNKPNNYAIGPNYLFIDENNSITIKLILKFSSKLNRQNCIFQNEIENNKLKFDIIDSVSKSYYQEEYFNFCCEKERDKYEYNNCENDEFKDITGFSVREKEFIKSLYESKKYEISSQIYSVNFNKCFEIIECNLDINEEREKNIGNVEKEVKFENNAAIFQTIAYSKKNYKNDNTSEMISDEIKNSNYDSISVEPNESMTKYEKERKDKNKIISSNKMSKSKSILQDNNIFKSMPFKSLIGSKIEQFSNKRKKSNNEDSSLSSEELNKIKSNLVFDEIEILSDEEKLIDYNKEIQNKEEIINELKLDILDLNEKIQSKKSVCIKLNSILDTHKKIMDEKKEYEALKLKHSDDIIHIQSNIEIKKEMLFSLIILICSFYLGFIM